MFIYIYIYVLPQRGRPRRSRSEAPLCRAATALKPTAFKPIGANIILYKTYIIREDTTAANPDGACITGPPLYLTIIIMIIIIIIMNIIMIILKIIMLTYIILYL